MSEKTLGASPSIGGSTTPRTSAVGDRKNVFPQVVDGNPQSLELNSASLDDAYKFAHGHADMNSAAVYDKRLMRKIDWWIVPISFCCYTMQFLDKVLVNYGQVMGMTAQLKLKGNEFNNCASAFFIAYLIAEVPNGLILQRMPAGKWLGFNVVAWGIACACTAAATNYHSLMAARIFLGIFEAAIAPCLMLISSQWYTKSEQAPRFSIWYCGLGMGQILGGLVSYGFQNVHKSVDIAGWKIMFIVIGLATMLFGVIAIFILPDTPMQARFLSDAEKIAVIKHVSVNQTGIHNKHFKFSQVLELLLDPQAWLMTLMTILVSISSGVITTYSSMLIKNFGFSSPDAALLNMPSGLVSIASTLIVGYGVRRTSQRWLWLVACCVPSILGGGLMSFLPKTNRAGLLAGIYMVNAVVATLIIIYQWTVSNCAGQTKRVVASALVSGAFSVGNIIGPQTFQAKDAPQYIPAKITVLATQAAAALVSVVLFLYYVWANRRKDTQAKESSEDLAVESTQEKDWLNLTDRQNKSFRYVY